MKAALILLSLLAVGHAAAIEPQIEAYSVLDNIIRNILEGMRPQLVNLAIPDVNQTIRNEFINANIAVRNISIRDLDKFVIETLKSSAVPLRLNNITLTLKEVSGNGYYDGNGTITAPGINFTGYGRGNGRVVLNNLFFTIGANFEMKDKVIQIKPRGLFGFDVRVGRATITLESINGSSAEAQRLGNLLSNAIPGLVNDLKKPLFDKYQDQIIQAINKILKEKQSKPFSDESVESNESDESE